MKRVSLFTDGACKGNPGSGGWGAILQYCIGGTIEEKELFGGEGLTTNNRMEMMALIKGLEALKEPCEVQVTTDSKYLVNALELGWAESWKANGWKKADKKQAQNIDLWEILLELTAKHKVSFCWVKGHDGHPENERADNLATKGAHQNRGRL